MSQSISALVLYVKEGCPLLAYSLACSSLNLRVPGSIPGSAGLMKLTDTGKLV